MCSLMIGCSREEVVWGDGVLVSMVVEGIAGAGVVDSAVDWDVGSSVNCDVDSAVDSAVDCDVDCDIDSVVDSVVDSAFDSVVSLVSALSSEGVCSLGSGVTCICGVGETEGTLAGDAVVEDPSMDVIDMLPSSSEADVFKQGFVSA